MRAVERTTGTAGPAHRGGRRGADRHVSGDCLYLRYRRLDRGIGPSAWTDGLLRLSAGLTLCVAAHTLPGHLDG